MTSWRRPALSPRRDCLSFPFRAITTRTSPPGLALDAASLETYRLGNILYDEDRDGHAFRHFYVASAQGGVLFEIVDREPGYAGYGAGNALVRMAALESA